MSKTTFVSSADANYYPMLREWIHSIRRFPQSKDMDICILDAGLSAEQVQKLTPLVNQIIKPDWPRKIPAGRIKGREYYKACVCRPFLPDIFKGYDLYIWMDADTWLQDWRAIELLAKGAEQSGLAIAPQTNRAYGKSMRIKWLAGWPWKPRSFYYSNARKAFDGKTARALFPHATLNAGVFSMSATAPHWKAWQDKLIRALDKGKVFTAEQLTLGMLVYLDKMSAELLPAYCNWLCEHKPLWDEKTKMFVEPYLPNEPIGIIHLSGLNEMRVDRNITTMFKTTQGKDIEYSYRYPYFDGERDAEAESLPRAC